MSSVEIENVYFSALEHEHIEGFARAHEHWAMRDMKSVDAELQELVHRQADTLHVPIDDGARHVQMLYLPPKGDVDETRTIALGTPYLNGISVPQYIRAKTLQELAAPNVGMYLMPNNTSRNSAYALNPEEQRRLHKGDISPLGEMKMAALEQLNKARPMGSLALTGYSQDALTVLAMGAAGSNTLHVSMINADEADSKIGRSAKDLQKDFTKPGITPLRNAIKDADIDALTQAMNPLRLGRDFFSFSREKPRPDSKAIHYALTGDANYLLDALIYGGTPVKLGFAADTLIFDPESIRPDHDNLRVVRYNGRYDRGHATGDNVIAHALMAQDGLTQLNW